MPAGPPVPDGGGPRRLTGLGPLPQREVADVVLAVLVTLHPFSDAQLLRIEAGEATVGRPRADPEEDRAVVDPIRIAAVEEGGDERDDLVDVGGGARQRIRPGHPQGVRVGEESRQVPIGQLVDPDPLLRRPADDLVVDVGDVHNPSNGVTTPAEMADEQVREQERPKVADVCRPVDGGATRVDADAILAERHQGPCLATQRVVQANRHEMASIVASASVEMERPAPSDPSRLPVEAFTLTRSGPR